MKKVFIAAMLASVAFTTPASAGLLDNITTAVTGHASDAYNRAFGKDAVLKGGVVLKSGMVDVDAVGQDAAHNAVGTVTVVEKDGKRFLQLGTDFGSGLAPDLYVYVSATSDINEEADFNKTVQVELGKLTRGKGASYYEIPEGTVVNSVTVWCKQFGAYMGSADVK